MNDDTRTVESVSTIEGCLIGQAIGDMMGLPYENLSPRRIARLARFDRPSFFLGYGCGSDDTEHAGLTADAVRFSDGDPAKFQRRLASNLRRWFLAGPPGIGLATLKSCLKMCLGFPLSRVGVHSAGNGPVMRAAILGVMVPTEHLGTYVNLSTRLTHTDSRAELGSLIVAQLAACARQIDLAHGAEWIRANIAETHGKISSQSLEPLIRNLRLAADACEQNLDMKTFAEQLTGTRGVSGFVAHTVPVAVFAFFRHGDDYATAIEQVIRAGGDTDTVAAITGALIGTRLGIYGIPTTWRTRHRDWPWTLRRLTSFKRPTLLIWPLMLLRNIIFFLIVLFHVARRMLPPW